MKNFKPSAQRFLWVFAVLTGIALVAFRLAPEPVTIWMIGDSTMSVKEKRAYPETGWGMPFASFFDETVTIENRAKNGRSTKTFITEGLWQPVADHIKAGDYLIIQFGHNDEVKTKASYATEEEFTANLTRFVTEAKSKGAKPILITPVARRKGFQDVLFCSGPQSRQYYQDCYIEGTTDFIFGPATAVFQTCHIHSKKNSHVTAASTPQDAPFGFVFFDCELTADTGLNRVSLGRPWKPYTSVTYIRCRMGSHILPEGWNNWKNPANEQTARFAEYKCTGPGTNASARFAWAHQLTGGQVKAYTLKNILGGKDNWSPLKD